MIRLEQGRDSSTAALSMSFSNKSDFDTEKNIDTHPRYDHVIQ